MTNMYEYPIYGSVGEEIDKNIIYKYAKKNNKELNLHLGCGSNHIDNYINIDLYNVSEGKPIQPDVMMDIQKISDFTKENTINKILIVHLLEHFNRWTVVDLLNSFYKCLKPTGILEIEMPDLDGAIDFYVNNRGKPYKSPLGKINRGRVQLYGNQWSREDYNTHKYLWTKDEIKKVLTDIGFSIVRLDNNARYHVKRRDMFISVKK